MTNSKQKGNSFERSIAKRLGAHFGIHFKRTPSSGAHVGGSNRAKNTDLTDGAKLALAGDIMVGDDNFKFSLELKAYNDDPKFHQIVHGDCKVLDGWIAQSDSDAAFVNKFPLLIFKINRKGEYAVFDRTLEDINLESVPHICYKSKYIVTLDGFLHKVLGPSYTIKGR